MQLTDEQKKQLHDFDTNVRIAGEEICKVIGMVDSNEPIDPLRLGIALGVMRERIYKRERFCMYNYQLDVW